ncbi:MAG: hypothetical protein Q9169_007805 [Polycauliona sp. 2 TL-2023]
MTMTQMASSAIALEEQDHSTNLQSETPPRSASPTVEPTEQQDEPWSGPTDPANPLNWPPSRKWSIIVLMSAITFVFSSCSSFFGPAVPQFLREFHSSSSIFATLTISEYAAGYILGPLVVAPLSELYGRAPVVHASNILFLGFTIACAVSTNIPMFIVFRLFQAFCVCGAGTLGPGLIADLMPVEQRGLAMTVFSVGPTLDPTVSPVVGGSLAEKAGWRWAFWFIAICAAFLSLLTVCILRETYTPLLLARKKAHAPSTSQTPNHEAWSRIRAAFIRPLKLLIHSPVTLILALQSSIALSYLNLILSTAAIVFQKQYHFSVWQSGFALFGLGIGFIIGQIAVGTLSDRWLEYQMSKRIRNDKGERQVQRHKPEDRLPPLIIGSLLIPISYFWYGWSLQSHAHWVIPIIGSATISIGAMFVFLPVSIYLVDAYTVFAASATAGNLMVRSIVSAVLPLAAEPLYHKIGYGWGSSVFAFVALGCLPVPFLLVRFGEGLRTSSRFKVEL